MGDVDEVGGELWKTVAGVVERSARACFYDDVTDADALVEQHETVFIGDAGYVSAEFVSRVLDRINPIAFAEIRGINAAIANDGECVRS